MSEDSDRAEIKDLLDKLSRNPEIVKRLELSAKESWERIDKSTEQFLETLNKLFDFNKLEVILEKIKKELDSKLDSNEQ